jgi:hypothetical protein
VADVSLCQLGSSAGVAKSTESTENKLMCFNLPAQCITLHPSFDPVCLNLYSLNTAYKSYRQQYGEIPGDLNRLVAAYNLH